MTSYFWYGIAKSLSQGVESPDQCFAWQHSAKRIPSLLKRPALLTRTVLLLRALVNLVIFGIRPSPQPAESDVHDYVIYETGKLVKSIQSVSFVRGQLNKREQSST